MIEVTGFRTGQLMMQRLLSILLPYLPLLFVLFAFNCTNIIDIDDDEEDREEEIPWFEPPTFLQSPQVAAGNGITCALLMDGSVKCWGRGDYGVLGRGDTDNIGDDPGEMGPAFAPVDLGTDSRAVQISARGSSVCALLEGGSVKCWGRGINGVLGQGNTDNIGDDPGEMGDNLAAIDLGTGFEALRIDVGNYHACALLDDDSLKCWGEGSAGKLGQGNSDDVGDDPGEMGDALAAIDLGSGRRARALGVGGSSTCAVLDSDDLKCWGSGSFGVLGSGSTSSIGDAPSEMGDFLAPVDLGVGRSAVSVARNSFHTCAVLDNGDLKCWGFGVSGLFGRNNNARIGDGPGEMGDNLMAIDLGTNELGANHNVIQVALGSLHACALLEGGSVKCWGSSGPGRTGQGRTDTLGDDTGEMGDALALVDLGTGRTAKSISAGFTHTCAVLDDDSIKCWGGGAYGQLGQGDSEDIGDEPGEMGDALAPIPLS